MDIDLEDTTKELESLNSKIEDEEVRAFILDFCSLMKVRNGSISYHLNRKGLR